MAGLAAAVERRPREVSEAPPSTFVVLFLSVLAVSWAAPLIRFSDAPALTISFWRLALSLPIIGAFLTARGEWRAFGALSRREWTVAGVAGIFLAAHFATWIASVGLTSVAASVALVASIDLKADEAAVLEVAKDLGVPARFFSAVVLEAETPRLKNPSEVVFREVGCHGVAEGAALAAAGVNGSLVVTKRKSARVTSLARPR